MDQVFDAQGKLESETITWNEEESRIDIRSTGQLALGGMTETESGGSVEIGATLRANASIELSGGVSTDGIGIRMPGGARIVTSNPDGRIVIHAVQDAEIYGQLVAGGEVVDHYDSVGSYLGSTLETYNGDSVLMIEAGGQIRLGRDLMAGALIDVRGGSGSGTPTAEDPWADEGIVCGRQCPPQHLAGEQYR